MADEGRSTPSDLYLRLSGAKKAAIVLLSLPDDLAAQVLKHMDRHDIDLVTMEMANLRKVSREVRDQVLEEGAKMVETQRYIVEGDLETAQAILSKAFDRNRAEDIIRRLQGQIQKRPFEMIKRVDPTQVLSFLQNEHPQTIALVMSAIDPDVSATVLAGLPQDLRRDVVFRIATKGKTSPEVVKEIERLLDRRFSSIAVEPSSDSGGIDAVVPILNTSDRSVEKDVLDFIKELDPDLAEEIRNRMFTFDNIVQLDDKSTQKILRHVDNQILATALKGVASEVAESIFRNMSEKAAKLLQDDMEVRGTVRLKEVESAQREVVAIIRNLEDQGEIVIARGENDEFIS